MKILIVIDQYDADNNGTTISAKRFVSHLRAQGHHVRVVASGNTYPDKYGVEEFRMPIFDGLIKSQGMAFAKADREVLTEAIVWSDVVHFMMPFALSIKGVSIAKALGKPHTAAFHVQPENITSSAGMKDLHLVNKMLYVGARSLFYNEFSHIHCPSLFIANQLKMNGYKAKLHVISNGIESDFCYGKLPKPQEWQDKVVITMIGRLSVEKRQDVLIEAVLRSKYANKIQLVFAGQGPQLGKLQGVGEKLPNRPVFGFYSKSALKSLLYQTDLYVHAADIEIEAIACIEAVACGLVPVIANSSRSATPQFALDKRSLFTAGDADDLAQTIDYWLDNPAEKERMEHIYADSAKTYNINESIRAAVAMFQEAIDETTQVNPIYAENKVSVVADAVR